MDNNQLINVIARRMNIEASTAARLVEGFAAVIGEVCGEENRIALPTFGTFSGVKRSEKIISDLSTGQRLMLPPAIELQFIPGGKLKQEASEGHAI